MGLEFFKNETNLIIMLRDGSFDVGKIDKDFTSFEVFKSVCDGAYCFYKPVATLNYIVTLTKAADSKKLNLYDENYNRAGTVITGREDVLAITTTKDKQWAVCGCHDSKSIKFFNVN